MIYVFNAISIKDVGDPDSTGKNVNNFLDTVKTNVSHLSRF